jgi:hypothetical protein
MEQLRALQQVELRLSSAGDHVSVLSGKLEDLLFRAQRGARALKDAPKAPDAMFGSDLQTFRRDVKAFGKDAGGLSAALGGIAHSAQCDETALAHFQAVLRLCEHLCKALGALLDKAVLAHHHIREAEPKVEAWRMVQEIESLVQQTQGLPDLANKMLAAVSPRKGAPVPSPVLQRRAAVPLRRVGRLVSSPPAAPQP